MQAINIIFGLILIGAMIVVSIWIYFCYVTVPSYATIRNSQYEKNELHQC